MKLTLWQICLAIYLVLVAILILTNIEIVFVNVAIGVMAILTAIFLVIQK